MRFSFHLKAFNIGGEAYWAARAVACPVFVPNWQALLLALPLFCLQINFSVTARSELCKVLFLALSVTFCLCMKYLGKR